MGNYKWQKYGENPRHWSEDRFKVRSSAKTGSAFRKGVKLYGEGDYARAERCLRKCQTPVAASQENALHEATLFWNQSQKVANAAIKMMAEKGFMHKFGEGEAAELAAAMEAKFGKEPETFFGIARAYVAAQNGLDFDIFARKAFRSALSMLNGHKADCYKKSMVHSLFAQVENKEKHLAEAARLAPDFGQD